MDCEAVVRALWQYLDRELGEEERAAVDEHLAECEHCRAHTEFEKRLIATIAAARAGSGASDELRARVLDMIRRGRPSEV